MSSTVAMSRLRCTWMQTCFATSLFMEDTSLRAGQKRNARAWSRTAPMRESTPTPRLSEPTKASFEGTSLDLATIRTSLEHAQTRAAFFERALARLSRQGDDTAREMRWRDIYNREACA